MVIKYFVERFSMDDGHVVDAALLLKKMGRALLFMLATTPLVLLPVLGALFLVTASPFFASARAFSRSNHREATIGGVLAGALWGAILFIAILIVEKTVSIYPSLGFTSQHIMLLFTLCFTSALFALLGARNSI
ncbi:MAG TPA: hypothetical protein ENF69_02290 [Euryarchaeota archaeon]|nr:hypothetical protein [Euryarchaeota archaeon]